MTDGTATAVTRPVSAAQLALWAEEQLDPSVSSSGYFFVTFLGPVRPEELRASALAVLRRHEPLRSVLRTTGDALRQLVLPAEAALVFETVEVPCPVGDEADGVAAWMRRGEDTRRWDLGTEAPIRFHLLVHGEDRASLVFSVHHAGFDGRSKFVVAQDFTAFLVGVRAGDPPVADPLPHPVLPEPDAETRAAAVAYWIEALADAPEPMALPGGCVPGRRGVVTTATTRLDRDLVRGLRSLAERHGATTFTTLVAALGGQLAGYGNPRGVLGIAADVGDAGTRAVAGVQINVVPMLVRVGRGTDPVVEAGAALDRLRRFRRVPFGDILARVPEHGTRRLATQLGISFPRPPAGLRLDVRGLGSRWSFFTPNTSATFEKTLQLRADWPDCLVRLDYRAETMGTREAEEFVADFHASVADLVAGVAVRSSRRPAAATAPAGIVEDRPVRPFEVLRDRAAWDPLGVALTVPGASITFRDLLGAVTDDPGTPDAASVTGTDPVRRLAMLVRSGDAAAGRPAGPAGGGDTLLWPATEPTVLRIEATAAWHRGATVRLSDDAAAAASGVGRICAPFRFTQALAEAVPAGAPVTLVLPLGQLQVTAALADWRAAGATVGAYHVVGDEATGWVEPADDPVRPPLLVPLPGVSYSVRSVDGVPLPVRVPGGLHVSSGAFPEPMDTGLAGRVTGADRVEYLGPSRRRHLRHHGFIDVRLVEAVLHAHPGVREAAVVLRATPRGPAAVAVVAPAPGAAVGPGEIRAAMRRRLEGFDLPGRIQVVGELPRTDRGEVDRASLAQPFRSEPGSDRYVIGG
ncbi:hypothetical protein KBX06_21090 [Micromonospora sp. C31]|uniref:condensation domain-containing protein n=1 Tax=Micromonospora sp. C31 TaxID=2824876 RepID=UPI001B3984D6|nr:condensation domain-containing protein [Micromonospora sp. C31]MBQ1075638.1 hypothetical protein [Micromonospora sp. C31]